MKKLLFWVLLLIISFSSAGYAAPNFSGYVRNRFITFSDKSYSFRFDELALGAGENLTDNISAKIGFLIYGSAYFIEHGYVQFSSLPFDGKLIIGQTRNHCFGLMPAKGNRITSNYGLASEMFTHDRVFGMQYMARIQNNLTLNLGIFNGYILSSRTMGDGGPNTVSVIADREAALSGFRASDVNNNKQISARVGYAVMKNVNLGVSASFAKLDPSEDSAALDIVADSNNNKIRAGLDFKCRVKPIVLQSEIYFGQTSKLTQMAYSVLAGYIFNSKLSAYARYGATNLSVTPTANQRTWDLSQITLTSIYKLSKRVILQAEYEMNMETVPAGSNQVDNDVFFIELTTTY